MDRWAIVLAVGVGCTPTKRGDSANTDTAPPPLPPGITTLVELEAGSGGMEVSADGLIYMGDFGMQLSGGSPGERVYEVTPDGTARVFAEGLYGASGNARALDGALLQSNIAGGWIAQIDADGQVSEYAAGLSGPVGIAVDEGGTLFVACCGDNTIARVSLDGVVETFAASRLLQCPNGIALAGDGNLYVANFYNGELLQVTPDGSVSRFASLPGRNLGHVTWGNEQLYVANRGDHTIASVALDGTVTTLAGTGERGAADGELDAATVSYTNDLALSPDGRVLYFNDVHPDVEDPNVIGPVLVRALTLP